MKWKKYVLDDDSQLHSCEINLMCTCTAQGIYLKMGRSFSINTEIFEFAKEVLCFLLWVKRENISKQRKMLNINIRNASKEVGLGNGL